MNWLECGIYISSRCFLLIKRAGCLCLKKINLLSCSLFAIQSALSIIFITYLLKLNVLPDSANIICVALIVLVFLLSTFLLIGKTKLKKIACALLAGIFIIIMIFPVRVMQKTHHTLNNLQGETTVYHTGYEILVRKDDKAEILSDVSKYVFGIDTSFDKKSANEALNNISKKLNGIALNYIEYTSSSAVWEALVTNKDVDVILIESAFYDMFAELYIAKGDSIENYVKKVENITVTINVEKPENPKPNENPNNEKPKELNARPFVIYVSGIDVAGKITTRSRSDVNILIVINPITKKMVLVTVPRDTYVPFPGITNGMYDKLTHAGIYGNNCSVSIATIETYIYTGVKIDRWIRVNFTSVERIVDALGGVTVESEFEFTQGGYKFVKGKNYLNGRQALAFSRNRKSFALGDQQRGKNQLQVIKGVFNKAISPAILTAYSDILNEIKDCVQTNLTYEDITGLVKMQLSDGASWDIDTASIRTTHRYDVCYSMSSAGKIDVAIMSEESRLEVIGKINAILRGE